MVTWNFNCYCYLYTKYIKIAIEVMAILFIILANNSFLSYFIDRYENKTNNLGICVIDRI